MIAGFEAAWAFFGGVFKVVIPDNLKAIVDQADAIDPRLNDSFREYAQARGFAVDPARVRHPRDKPRVEKCVQYVRSSFFAGEDFTDLADCRERAASWCVQVAAERIHGTTGARPGEVFAAEEAPLLGPVPTQVFSIPVYTKPKVAPDRHVEVARALYSVPGELIGQRLLARADAQTVKLFSRGQLIKVHPRQEPGRRHTDPADLPSEVCAYAMRDLDAHAPLFDLPSRIVGSVDLLTLFLYECEIEQVGLECNVLVALLKQVTKVHLDSVPVKHSIVFVA